MAKTPPLLLGATLVFWGWQSGFLLPGLLMAVIAEAARWVRIRWDLSEQEFSRIWTLCVLLALGAVVLAFADNEGPAEFRGFFADPNPFTTRKAGSVSSRTAAAIVRWLPMVFFPFMAAQLYSTRGAIPIETVSLILRMRWRKAKQLGQQPRMRSVDIGLFYFVMCLFSAGIHAGEDMTYFWGLAVLLGWALYGLRSSRFRLTTWGLAMVIAVAFGFYGQRSFAYLRSYLENVNPQWFTRFSRGGGSFDARKTKTAIGRVGRVKLSGSIALRLRVPDGTPPPSLLREASYRTFKFQTWDSETLDRDYDPVQGETNGTTFVLTAGRTNEGHLEIACYLRGNLGVLPLPHNAHRLERLQAFDVRKNPCGAVLVQGPGLLIFDAFHGGVPALDAPPATNLDFTVPSRDEPALDAVIAEIGARPGEREDALRKIRELFARKFAYRVWQDAPRTTNGTPLTRFLLQTRAGHCEYFATATTLLLRRLQIPARYAVGFAVHEKSGANHYVARYRDAHAWALVWNDRTAAWEPVDNTPASWIQVEENRASIFQVFSDAWSRLVFEFSRFRWGQTQLRQYILWGLIPVLLVLVYQIVTRTRRRREAAGKQGAGLSWPGLDSEFYAFERRLAARGLPRLPGETLSTWIARVGEQPALQEMRRPLQELLQLHYRYRFDPRGLTTDDRESLARQARDCLRQLA